MARWRAPPLCAAALVLAACGGSQEARRSAPARPDVQHMLEYVAGKGAPGVVALVRNRSGTWRGATGFARLEPPRGMTPRDRFRVGSVTKTFVATLTLQLVAEGRLRLDDPLERHLPGLLSQGRRITIRQLLNHTSGLYDYLRDEDFNARAAADPDFNLSPHRTVAIAAARPLEFLPGTEWRYSNTGYQVLGLVLERVTGKRLGGLLTERIFEPLLLGNTSFEPLPPLEEPIVHGYYVLGAEGRPLPNERGRDVTQDALGGVWADGAIVSTVDDLARFYAALLSGKLLPDDQLVQMRRTVPATPPAYAYGLGLARWRLPCGYAWGHDGNVAGYLTSVLASADGLHVVVVAANGDYRGYETAFVELVSYAYCRS